jgi:ectoine hydroxylase-related dioxygenase (phytanoyl-CoA dioxygenase family)
MLTREQCQGFAANGFVVVPDVVPAGLVDSARRRIAEITTASPPPRDHRGPHPYWLESQSNPALLDLLVGSPAFTLAESLVRPHHLNVPEQAQLALTFPPFPHRPGGPHIDGLTPLGDDGQPGTFTMLAGVLLTDQPGDDMGNLWVWAGTHLASAAYFRENGPEALYSSAPYPPVNLPEPQQVHGNAGDLILAHYLLAHNIGGNTAPYVRETVYFRLCAAGHRARWREVVQNALLEFAITDVD